MESNRGNHLLVKLLEHRYPKLIEKETLDSLWSFLSREESGQLEKMAELKIEEKDMLSKLPESKDFPSTVGEEMKIEDKIKLLLFLANDHSS